MSLFSDYQMAINSLAEERRHKDQIGYQNYQQSEANRQGTLKGLTNAAMGAALMYAFPPAGMAAGKAATMGAGLGYMGGGNATMLPYLMNKGGTPTTGSDVVSSGGGSVGPTGGLNYGGDNLITPTLTTSPSMPNDYTLNYLRGTSYNPSIKRGMMANRIGRMGRY